MPSPRMDIKSASRKLGMSSWWIRLQLKAGRIPAYKLGGVWRFDEAELDAWLAARHKSGHTEHAPRARSTTGRG